MSGSVRALVLASLLLGGCASAPVVPPGDALPMPDPASIDRLVLVLGDPGKAVERYHPLLPHLHQEVERWSAALGRDSAVSVLVLGDVIYPNGMHGPEDREDFPVDSALLMDQLDIVAGPAAREHRAQMYFVAGNHDYGSEQHEEGNERLANLDAFLTARREEGLGVRLLPQAGDPGPAVIDAGPHMRLVLLDTAWWLLQSRGARGQAMLDGVDAALRDAGERHVVIAAHHPFRTAGPHGGELSFLEELGVGYVLKRAGAILQDLNSPPYRRLRAGLAAIFERRGQPLLYAGGHEHSLQVLEARSTGEPRYSLVSGSASKVTPVGHADGMRFKLSAPGYFLLAFHHDGAVELHAVAAPVEYLACPQTSEQALQRCMEQGVRAYEPRWSLRLAGPGAPSALR